MSLYVKPSLQELQPDDFGVQLDIVGQYEAFIVMSHVRADIAAARLPPELELAPAAGTPAGMHPVMISLGKHRHVHPDGFNLLEYDYDEALVGLPHVAVSGGDGAACFFMTDLRLNNLVAQALGVALGLPKHMATMTNADMNYAIDTKGTNLLQASMQLDGKQFGEDHPHFAVIAKMMLQPVVSKIGREVHITRFTFDTANAFMVPARMALTVATNEIACLPRGTYQFDTIDKGPFDGAYLSIHSWRLSQGPSAIVVPNRRHVLQP